MSLSSLPGIARFGSLAEAGQQPTDLPFVIRGARELEALRDPDAIVALLRDSTVTLFGYQHGDAAVEATAAVVHDAWQAGTLGFNLVDATFLPLLPLVPRETRAALALRWIALVLTRAPAFTELHVDPPGSGGGWMYLATGRKHWVFAPAGHASVLFDEDDTLRTAMPLAARVVSSPDAGWTQCEQSGGDFLYFPPRWAHAVTTTESSVGAGGYWKRGETSLGALPALDTQDEGPDGPWS